MARAQLGNDDEVTAVGGSAGYSNLNGGTTPGAGMNMGANSNSVDAMRARLTAINATTYSATELDKMTVNDMLYAIRLADAPTSIK